MSECLDYVDRLTNDGFQIGLILFILIRDEFD